MAAGAHDWFPAQFVQLVRPRIDIESRPYRCTIRTSGSLAEGGGVRSAGGQVPSYRVRAEQEPRGPPRRGCGHGWPRWLGRASGRERVCRYVEIWVVAGDLRQNTSSRGEQTRAHSESTS